MSITPKRIDIANRVLPDEVIGTESLWEIDQNDITISLVDTENHDKQYAMYTFSVPITSAQDEFFGIIEGLCAARLATEATVNVVHQNRFSVPEGYGELLSKYGMAEVRFAGRLNAPVESQNLSSTLMFSGGADSSHILFKRLQGDCNLVSFNHGQANYRQGIHPEEEASKLVPSLARHYFRLPIRQQFVRTRWKSYLPRKWAKAYRNLMFMVHAAIFFPDTNIIVGTSVDDRLHDSFPDFISEFSKTTGIVITAPNLYTGRDVIMKDLVEVSLNHIPYYLASTSSCQLQRYLGKKYMQCGSCHSCLLRLPAAVCRGDPRFSNFRSDLKVIPEYLENVLTPNECFKRKPSINALKVFFEDLGTEGNIYNCFLDTTWLLDHDWKYNPKRFLTEDQYSIYQSTMIS